MNKIQNQKIGVIGLGYVGSAIYSAFSIENFIVKGYDIDNKKNIDTISSVLESDFVFVCLPTPMSNDGSCDLNYLNNFFNDIINNKFYYKYNQNTIFIIKSTVPVGTTEIFHERMKGMNYVVHSPEFLSARTARIDFITSSRHIVGGEEIPRKKVADLYRNRFTHIPVLEMSSKESEIVKYMCNCFYAVKISFMNELFLFSKIHETNWESILNGFLSSGWVSPMHTQVPGHDEKLGYGGACFPKDINSLICQMSSVSTPCNVIESSWKTNKQIRE